MIKVTTSRGVTALPTGTDFSITPDGHLKVVDGAQVVAYFAIGQWQAAVKEVNSWQ